MQLRILGASGAEFPGFNPPAFLIDKCLLLDAGTIGAVLDESEQWCVRNILLTHAHLDHIRAIPFLADNIIVRNKKHHVTIMASAYVLKALKSDILNDRIWPDFTRIPNAEAAVLRLSAIRPGVPFKVDGYGVTAYKVNHSVPANGYVIEDHKGRRLLYTGDTGPTDAIWKETARGIDCAIIEVSMPNRMRGMAIMTGHLTASLLKAEIAKMRALPDRILITHPKPQYLKRIMSEIKALGLSNISLIRQGQVLTV